MDKTRARPPHIGLDFPCRDFGLPPGSQAIRAAMAGLIALISYDKRISHPACQADQAYSKGLRNLAGMSRGERIQDACAPLETQGEWAFSGTRLMSVPDAVHGTRDRGRLWIYVDDIITGAETAFIASSSDRAIA